MDFIQMAFEVPRYAEKKASFKLDCRHYNPIITRLSEERKVDEALRFFYKMLANGVSPSIMSITPLIREFCAASRLHEAEKLLGHIKAHDIELDLIAFNVLIHAYGQEGKMEIVEGYLAQMKERKIMPTIQTYTSVICGYSLVKDISEARRVFDSLGRLGVRPNTICYNSLILGYCDSKNLDEARYLFDQIPTKGLVRSTHSYNIMIRGMMCCNRVADGLSLLEEMKSSLLALAPDLVSYSTVIDGLSKAGHTRRALSVFRSMENEGIKADLVAYTSLIYGFCNDGDLNMVEYLLIEFQDKGIEHDLKLSTILGGNLAERGMFKDPMDLIITMEGAGFCPNAITFNVIVRALLKNKNHYEATVIMDQMLARGFRPDVDTIYMLIEDDVMVEWMLGTPEEVSASSTKLEAPKPSLLLEETRQNLQESRERRRKKKEVDDEVKERETEKKLRPANEEIARLHDTDLKSLLRRRKLYLVLDLDHTLLNSARLEDITVEEGYLNGLCDGWPDSLKSSLHRLKKMHMMTKLRPFIHTFLEEANELFDMCIYTKGERSYAIEMAELLDPEKKYFTSKVIAKEDCTESHQKVLNAVMGKESVVLILDDTEAVWGKHKDNLIMMEIYHFFASSCKELGFPRKSFSEQKTDESETDGTLATILKVLQRTHSLFFDQVPEGDLVERDVREVLETARKDILKDCKVVFSPEEHNLWKMAERLGATCSTELDPSVTHVVSRNARTRISREAVKEKKFLVNPRWIEASNYSWGKQPEENFPVSQC